MTDLRRRVMTATLLIPLVVALVEGAPTAAVGGAFAVAVAAASWEWAAFCGWRAAPARATYLIATLGVLGLAALAVGHPFWSWGIVGGGLLWWLAALYWVAVYQRRGPPPQLAVLAGESAHSHLAAPLGWLVLVPAWLALVELHARPFTGPHLLLGLLVVIWSADTAAYFAGRRFGRTRLASRVSPGKTWEGVAGGALAAIAVALALAVLVGLPTAAFALVGLVTAAFSVLGDLTESLFKRRAGLKDSGGLLPGHGGVLDRIDSLTAGAPAYLLAVALATR